MGVLVGSATQGAANAFVESSVATALTGQTKRAYKVDLISFEISGLNTAADQTIEIALSRRSKTAMPNITDLDVLFKKKIFNDITTSGEIVMDAIFTFAPPGDILLVEDPIYLLVDSNGSGVAYTVDLRIDYTDKTISEVDRLTLLTQSLS